MENLLNHIGTLLGYSAGLVGPTWVGYQIFHRLRKKGHLSSAWVVLWIAFAIQTLVIFYIFFS